MCYGPCSNFVFQFCEFIISKFEQRPRLTVNSECFTERWWIHLIAPIVASVFSVPLTMFFEWLTDKKHVNRGTILPYRQPLEYSESSSTLEL